MTSLRRQLTRWLTGTLAVLAGAALAAIYFLVDDQLVDDFDAALQTRALSVSALVEQTNSRVEFDFSEDFLRGYRAERPRNYFEVWDAAGNVVRRSPSLGAVDLPRRGGDTPGTPQVWNLTLPSGRAGRAIGFWFVPKPIVNPGGEPLRVLLVVAADRKELNETLDGVIVAVAGSGIALLAAVWLVVPWVLRRGLRPLDRLGEQVTRIDADSLNASLAVDSLPAELRPIGDRLNDLLARLAASFERERRFSADLAHELRTPLAELRSLAECALKWPETRDPATDRDVLAVATQMEALVTRMLALARAERASLASELVPVEIAPLVDAAWRPFAERAQARGLRVSLALAPGAARADPVLLRSIVTNLFDNAVAYAPAGGEVRVLGQARADGYALRCANPAGELGADDVGKLFERFWRKEAARSGGGEHVGLGLSLARTLAAAMGWRLSAALDAERWLVLTLETGDNA